MTCYADTNIFIRYLTQDIPEQAEKAEKRFLQAKEGGITLILTSFTVVEILYVLQEFYKMDKNTAVAKLQTIISPEFIKVEKKEHILEALLLFKIVNIDFVDLLNWTIAKEDKAKILSFDKDFDKLTPKLRIEP